VEDKQINYCPICGSHLRASNENFALKDIFNMWAPQVFSDAVIQEHLAISSHTSLFRCSSCELEIFLPKVIGLPSFYEAASHEAHSSSTGYYENTKWDFYEAARDVDNNTLAVIEFGCGPGNFLHMIQSRVQKVIGVEFNPQAAEMGRAQNLKIYESLDYPEKDQELFDAAFSFHVLEHVEDPLVFLQSMKAQLKPGGIIGISVPNQDGPIRFINPCAMNMPPHHATRWRLRTFRHAANELGLSIKRVSYEPLLLENHSYYSVYWPKYLLPSDAFPSKVLRIIISLPLRAFFGVLCRAGLKYFRFLRGQSIYVLMEKS